MKEEILKLLNEVQAKLESVPGGKASGTKTSGFYEGQILAYKRVLKIIDNTSHSPTL